MQEPLPSQSGKKTGHKQTKNFRPTEHEIICSACLNVSKDLIIGVNQTMQCYSVRIIEFYNGNKKTANSRTSFLQHRWSDIQKDHLKILWFLCRNRKEEPKLKE
jgi:hypothetical protein